MELNWSSFNLAPEEERGCKMAAGKNDILELKLRVELEEPSELFSKSFLEDIYGILTLSEWSDAVMLRLIKTPHLLQEIAWALRNDDAFDTFFEQRVRALILELAGD